MLIRYVEQYIGVQEREIIYSWGKREIERVRFLRRQDKHEKDV